MVKKLLLTLGAFAVLSTASYAQKSKRMVFFNDKVGVEYSVDSPEEFLSQKSLERRQKHGILVTEEDLPVSQAYLDDLANRGYVVKHTTKWMNAALVLLDDNEAAAVEALDFVKEVEYIGPNNVGLSRKKEEQTKFDREDALQLGEPSANRTQADNDWQNEMMNVPYLHAAGVYGSDVMVAIFDAGFPGVDTTLPFKHLFDGGQIVATKDYLTFTDDVYRYDDHGTKVLSTIGAVGVNVSYQGIAPKADFVLCVTDHPYDEYRDDEYNYLFACEFADSLGVDVINSSLGYTTFDEPEMSYSYNDTDGETAVSTKAASMAADKGIFVITSAGNDGNAPWHYISVPADAKNVLSIGSVTSTGVKSGFSSFGPTADQRIKPDVSAMGSSTCLINEYGNIAYSSGTSFSGPLVAGLAALFVDRYSDLSSDELREFFRNGSSNAENPNNEIGWGIPNAETIDQLIQESGNVLSSNDNLVTEELLVYPNPTSSVINLPSQFATNEKLSYRVIALSGREVLSGNLLKGEKEISVENLREGVYILVLETASSTQKIKFLKK
ncbi:S8 family peptidase [Aureibacter tunicatorum]|uniref:Subtilisin family serine protease n=1 Tax=Aureibacter tunicatorum TaxID=866807 RepID=A0AAE3XRH4_9BACT|nr:S8 family peptidase [Aureibacter tunicatorum]MDR6240713.1 subtilisin family serine protease [Aureibacter tunicatorum]BDD06954.1 peptidase S8 [Aureibacter tunicatorum]